MKTKIHFGKELANIYEVGFLITDISQLIAFVELLSTERTEEAEKYFGEKSKGFNRYASIYKLNENANIIDIKKGSIEITAEMTLAAAIVVPIVIELVKGYLNQRNETVNFTISPDDDFLVRCIDGLEDGKIRDLERLFDLLRRNNYNVESLAQNVMLIEHVTNKYAQKMVRTIRKKR